VCRVAPAQTADDQRVLGAVLIVEVPCIGLDKAYLRSALIKDFAPRPPGVTAAPYLLAAGP
jgi:hypothetical protein